MIPLSHLRMAFKGPRVDIELRVAPQLPLPAWGRRRPVGECVSLSSRALSILKSMDVGTCCMSAGTLVLAGNFVRFKPEHARRQKDDEMREARTSHCSSLLF